MSGDPRAGDDMGNAIRDVTREVRAPAALRAGVAEQRRRSAHRRRRTRRWAAITGAAVLAAVALVALLSGVRSSPEPSLASATAVSLAPTTAPAPGVDGDDARFLRAGVEAVRFPNYAYESSAYGSPWVPVGRRVDRLHGRRAVTVRYTDGSVWLGYTVVDGPPLRVPSAARAASADGVDAAVLRDDGAVVVTWRRGGHTCVLASRDVPAEELLRLATWG